METINDFKGLLIYTLSSPNYDETHIKTIITKAPDISDFVILNIDSDEPSPSETLKVAKMIFQQKSNARLWIGTNKYDSMHLNVSATSIINNLNSIKNTFNNDSTGRKIWSNCVKGIYLNMESIYHTINYEASPEQNNAASFVVARDVSKYVHDSLNLNFLWIPYYGRGANEVKIIKDIAYMVARTDIFDLVIIQPSYYFGGEAPIGNLNGVKYSVEKNNICYRDDVEVFQRTSHRAKVGFEMEVDNLRSTADKKERRERYEEYVNKFNEFTDVPMCYYAGGIKAINDNYIYYLMEDFYGISYGDADKNGILSSNDSSIALEYSLSGKVPDEILRICDVDGSGTITANDAACILQRVLDNSYDFPIMQLVYGYDLEN